MKPGLHLREEVVDAVGVDDGEGEAGGIDGANLGGENDVVTALLQ